MGSFAWNHLLDISVGIFRLDRPLGPFHRDVSLTNFRLSAFALKHSLGKFRLGPFVWELSLGIFRLRISAWDVSLGISRFGSLGTCRLGSSRGTFRLGSSAVKLSLAYTCL